MTKEIGGVVPSYTHHNEIQMRKCYNKQGSALKDAPFAVMIVIVLGLFLAVGSMILLTMDDTSSVSPVTTYNESVTLANNTYTALTQPRGLTITAVTNATAGEPGLELGNFTMLGNRSGSSIAMTGYPEFVSAAYWVQYTYSADSATSDVLTSTVDSVGVFGDWLVIIAIVIVAVVVLSLIKYL